MIVKVVLKIILITFIIIIIIIIIIFLDKLRYRIVRVNYLMWILVTLVVTQVDFVC